jgi:hypothetical protein
MEKMDWWGRRGFEDNFFIGIQWKDGPEEMEDCIESQGPQCTVVLHDEDDDDYDDDYGDDDE